MIRLAAFAIWAFLGVAANAQAIPDAQRALFLEFVRDVSGNDTRVVEKAKALIATPPTTLEEIGFYGLEGAPAPERALRGIISVLGNEGFILEFEDKYIYEMPLVLEHQGLANFGEEPLSDPLALFASEIDHEDGPTEAQWQVFRSNFGPHLRTIETGVRRTGHEFLSLSLPLGDTMHVWIAPRDIAERWRNRALYAGVNTLRYPRAPFVSMSVTDPDWKTYWGFMTYALLIPEAFSDMPDYE